MRAALKLLSDSKKESESRDGSSSAVSNGLGSESTHWQNEWVQQRFEQHAASTPNAIALKFREAQLTYAELNARANVFAHLLLARGVGADCRVMVCLEPSFDIVVAILGILKAGAVYVPLDPYYPAARVQALLADVEPKLVFTQDRLLEKIELDRRAISTTSELTQAMALASSASRENPVTPIQASQTACIYYTSGTTGHPKGVMLTHSNLRHYLRAAQERYQIGSSDILPAVARFSFSISMFELLSPLVSGGATLLLEREQILDARRMCQTLSEVTFFHIGPSLLKGLTAHIRAHDVDTRIYSKVRHASSGGDVVTAELLESLKSIFREAEVFVIYGCSEISCMGCTWPAPRDRTIERAFVGRPFDQVQIRVLDPSGNPVEAGALGEIHFAGEGLSAGYLHQPEETAAKFVHWNGVRWYRTGDMGRLSPEGDLQFAGRQDFQIQLRGMRVELGEVEHYLRRAPGVKDGVVVAKELEPGEKSLVAYFVAAKGNTETRPESNTGSNSESNIQNPAKADRAAVRDYLRAQLPDYLVPSIYVELEQLPLNHNFKLDRRALPEPTPEDRRVDAETGSPGDPREPQSPTEKALAQLWRDLLGVAVVTLDDRFFDLGGDSLRAINLIARVESALGVVLEGLQIVREPLGALAEICDQRRGLIPVKSLPIAPRRPQLDPIEPFHFGINQSLYGVLHAQRGTPCKSAVLICPPLGAESVRALFVLQRLASQLATRGVSTLRFDYFGTGDSLGESVSAGVVRWENDILAAWQELKERTGAERVTVVGVRLGAALLSRVLHHFDVARWVLWDPVCDGSNYFKEMSLAQKRYLRNARYRRRWQSAQQLPNRVELGGVTYSTNAIDELKRLTLAPLPGPKPRELRWLYSASEASPTGANEQRHWFQITRPAEANASLTLLEHDCGWGDLDKIERSLADGELSALLLKMVTDP